MSDLAWYLIGIFGCLILSAFYSGAETGYYALNRVRLRYRLQERHRGARRLAWVVRDPQVFVFTMLVGTNLATFIASSVTTGLYDAAGIGKGREGLHMIFRVIPWNAELAATYTLTPLFFLFAEVAPKNLFRARANTLMYAVTNILRLSVIVFYPLTLPLRMLAGLLGWSKTQRQDELQGLSRRRLGAFFVEGATEGALSDHQKDMVTHVLRMRQTSVTRAMIPIEQAVCASVEAKVRDFRDLVQGRGISRVALYRGTRGHVVGLVHIFDIMADGIDPDDPLERHARPVTSIPRQSSLQKAFYSMRRNKQAMTLVVDERDQCIGLLSLEDIARHIVGRGPRGALKQSAA